MGNSSYDLIFDSDSESETDRLGQMLAACVPAGLVIALNGQLGSGKTRFVRALCTALGVDADHVNSPTFVLMQLYTDGRLPVAHFDTYRLADVDEFLSIGADEFLNAGDFVCLIEWADRVADILPADHLQIHLEQTGVSSRRFSLTAGGPLATTVLQSLKQLLHTSLPMRQAGSDNPATGHDAAAGDDPTAGNNIAGAGSRPGRH